MKIFIKHMVSLRCKMAVKSELNRLGIGFLSIGLGEVELTDDITTTIREQIRVALEKSGLELIEDKKSTLVNKIKNTIIEMVQDETEIVKVNCSEYLIQKMNHSYTYLSGLFSETQGSTIEHFIIFQKIERVKQLIRYNKLNLTEIAWKLNYSSVAHLSHQFKKTTGVTPSTFKSLENKRGVSLA